MPTPPLPTRHQVDQAQPLEFAPAPRAERQDVSICIELAPDGLHIRCDYLGSLASIPAAVERLRAAGVLELVATSRPAQPAQTAPAAGQQQRKASKRVEPEYSADGDALCPVHQKPLVEGRFGLYCPSRAQAGEQANEKGYCSLRFSE